MAGVAAGSGAGGGDSRVWKLVATIIDDLNESGPEDELRECPISAIKQLDQHPEAVLDMATKEMGRWRDAAPPGCWLRLYEDASLSKAVKILSAVGSGTNTSNDWISEIVETLEDGIANSAAPARMPTFEKVFQALENFIEGDPGEWAETFRIEPPEPINTVDPDNRIQRTGRPLDVDEFQTHLNESASAIIMPGCLENWTALRRWQDPAYIYRMTLGGRRLVPVEIGESYTAANYRTKTMQIREFIETFVLPEEPEEVAYLAQHDLFTQIPSLREDITIPDFCYTAPPHPVPGSAASLTSGLNRVSPLSQPLLNAWLGPKGTKTPLHTDPYHNILCQVVGYKYVRLYRPDQRQFLYPGIIDENGVDHSNTSRVDISAALPYAKGGTACPGGGPHTGPNLEDLPGWDMDKRRIAMAKEFRLFAQAKYVEGILGPGECLYIPLGTWHFVESLTISMSVSFWWN